jgi:hypothetical protein
MRGDETYGAAIMLIRVGYDIGLYFLEPTAMVLRLSLHPSRASTIRQPERVEVQPHVAVSEFIDTFGNRCSRVFVPAGRVMLHNEAIIEDNGQPDLQVWDAPQHNVQAVADGCDAADIALTTTFGVHQLVSFTVWTDEVSEEALRQPQYSPRF